MLEHSLRLADEAVIGIGSSNKYNMRNPFTAAETRGMLDAYLSRRFKNYRFVDVTDFAHEDPAYGAQRWTEFVKANFPVHAIVTANKYVASLLQNDFGIIDPVKLIPSDQMIDLRATQVRYAMAGGDVWERFVPHEVATYMRVYGLDKRFVREFGEKTLQESIPTATLETADAERAHTFCGNS